MIDPGWSDRSFVIGVLFGASGVGLFAGLWIFELRARIRRMELGARYWP